MHPSLAADLEAYHLGDSIGSAELGGKALYSAFHSVGVEPPNDDAPPHAQILGRLIDWLHLVESNHGQHLHHG